MSPDFIWPNQQDREEITRLLFVNDAPMFCDVGIVFGCSDARMMKMRAMWAAELFHLGILPKLILCGGLGPPTEASIMAEFMDAAQVPRESYILEDKSRTTVENLRHTRDLLVEHHIIPRSVGLVSCDWHMRRCLEIGKFLLGTRIRFLCLPHEEACFADNWWQSEEGCIRILNELRLLARLSASIGSLPEIASIEWYRRMSVSDGS